MSRPLGLFVVGTMLPGEPDDGLLAAIPSEPATARGRLYLHPARYPLLVLDPAGGPVEGVLYRQVEDRLLPLLDLIAGADGKEHLRVITEVQGRSGAYPAHAYTTTAAAVRRLGLPPLPVPSWRRFTRRGATERSG